MLAFLIPAVDTEFVQTPTPGTGIFDIIYIFTVSMIHFDYHRPRLRIQHRKSFECYIHCRLQPDHFTIYAHQHFKIILNFQRTEILATLSTHTCLAQFYALITIWRYTRFLNFTICFQELITLIWKTLQFRNLWYISILTSE